ncbi:hypothetical protein Q1695_016379 [Nippostrongylus brasiliensis]|nr:hypothetical protein Q1695_016379 [Nippostrongylus brasiliensis]
MTSTIPVWGCGPNWNLLLCVEQEVPPTVGRLSPLHLSPPRRLCVNAAAHYFAAGSRRLAPSTCRLHPPAKTWSAAAATIRRRAADGHDRAAAVTHRSTAVGGA